jgi:transcriptional regulator with XRE-family HTH domain
MTKGAFILEVGSVLQAYRKQKNLTQVEVAIAIGVSQASVSKFERGLLVPTLVDWLRLSFVLGFEFRLPDLPDQPAESPEP